MSKREPINLLGRTKRYAAYNNRNNDPIVKSKRKPVIKALKTEKILKSTSFIETIRKPALIKKDNEMYNTKILNKAENRPLKIF